MQKDVFYKSEIDTVKEQRDVYKIQTSKLLIRLRQTKHQLKYNEQQGIWYDKRMAQLENKESKDVEDNQHREYNVESENQENEQLKRSLGTNLVQNGN